MRARAAPSPGPAPTTTARLNMLLTVRYTATRVCKRSTPRLPRGKFPSRAFTRNGERPRRRVSLFETLPRPCIVARVLGWICSVQRSHGYSCSSRSLRPLSPGISTRSSGWTDPVPTRTSSEPVRRLRQDAECQLPLAHADKTGSAVQTEYALPFARNVRHAGLTNF